MQVHLIDGTYELFRHFHGAPEHLDPSGVDVGAVRGVCGSMLQLLEEGATHVAVATDTVIESFRNEMYAPYKDGSGIEPVLWAQFPLLEGALTALGLTVWPLVEFEADDGLAAAAAIGAADPRVERVLICTPDKDLGQCVNDRIVQVNRREGIILDAAGIFEKFGVWPESIPDYLALVGDSADGFPGLPGWGKKSASLVLAEYGHLEAIPANPNDWRVTVRGAAKLGAVLRDQWDDALLFRDLATLRRDVPVGTVDDWEWRGPTAGLSDWATRLGAGHCVRRANALVAERGIS
jgi:5'-3' exonuclease